MLEKFCKPCLLEDFEKFGKWLSFKGLSKNTIKSYFSDILQSLRFLGADEKISLDELINFDLNSWRALLAHFQEIERKGTTQQRLISAWKKWAQFKQKEGKKIAISKIKYPKLEEKLPRAVESDKIAKLKELNLDSWQDYRNVALISLLYSSGIRINEALNIKWMDLSQKHCKVLGKGNKTRYVPILDETRNKIAEYKEKLPFKKGANDYVFLGARGGKWHACSAARWFRQQSVNSKITPHSLRHSCATHLIQNGCDLRSVQILLGHASLETTQHYIQHSNSMLKKIYDRAICDK